MAPPSFNDGIFVPEDTLPDSKIYELVIHTKDNTENQRDQINQYYTTLFAAIISVIPFIDNIVSNQSVVSSSFSVKTLLIILSLIGLILTVSWIMTLKRLCNLLEAIDQLLIELETKYNQSFVKYIASYLSKINAPERITKQTMLVPYGFAMVFMLILCTTMIYSLTEVKIH